MAKAKTPRSAKVSTEAASLAPTASKVRRSNAIHHPIPELAQKSGNLLVCGQNDVGQLGLSPDDVMEKTRPALVAGISDVVDVQAGGMHSLVLTKSGEIWSFGCNDEGALGRDTSEEGSEATPKRIVLPGTVVRISAGDSHSACLLDDGRVFAWGSFRDSHGSMGLTKEGNKKSPVQIDPSILAVDIASGSDHLVILSQDGKVFTIGCAEQGQLGRVSARTLTGESRRGKNILLTPETIPKKAGNFIASAIWATPFCTFLKENKSDQIYGFGLNNYNQLGVKKGGNEFEHFSKLSQFTNVFSIAGGQHHTVVLTNDNTVFSIGRKDYGRLGVGDVEKDITELTPIKSLSGQKISKISCGESNSFAVTVEGRLYVWGMGTNSQLGTGDEDDVSEPKLLVSAQVKDKHILTINSGGQHSLFLVEVPESTAKPVKVSSSKTVASTTAAAKDPTDSEANSKENGAAAKPVGRGKKKAESPVVMESDSTTDVNGNAAKNDKMEVDSTEGKKAKKRKA